MYLNEVLTIFTLELRLPSFVIDTMTKPSCQNNLKDDLKNEANVLDSIHSSLIPVKRQFEGVKTVLARVEENRLKVNDIGSHEDFHSQIQIICEDLTLLMEDIEGRRQKNKKIMLSVFSDGTVRRKKLPKGSKRSVSQKYNNDLSENDGNIQEEKSDWSKKLEAAWKAGRGVTEELCKEDFKSGDIILQSKPSSNCPCFNENLIRLKS